MWQPATGTTLASVITVTQDNAQAVLGGTIDSNKLYEIDGVIDMGSTPITVPSSGIQIRGLGMNVSHITSSADGYTMFVGDTAGDVFIVGLSIIVDGTGSQVFGLTSGTGFAAVEMERVNFGDARTFARGCTSLGELTDYRQVLELNTGRFVGTPALTLAGSMNGYRLTTTIVRGMDAGMTGALFKAGTGLVFSGRFLTDINVDLPASASLMDFAPANFDAPGLLQLRGVQVTRGGVFDTADTNITPNISAEDLESDWQTNRGLPNTFVGATIAVTTEAATSITAANTWTDLAGTWTLTDDVHMDQPASNQIRNLGDNPREFSVSAALTIEGPANDQIELRWMRYQDSTATSAVVPNSNQTAQITRLLGLRDVSYVDMLAPVVTLDKGDYVWLQIQNLSSSGNLTAEVGSRARVDAL